MPPLVSIIIVVLNGADTLELCLDSVSKQSYSNKEVVIVDGGSTDGTLDIIKDRSDQIAYWKSEPDRGVYDAFNKGVRWASGDWILFLGCDDFLWKNDVLERMAPSLTAAYPGHKIVYGTLAIGELDGGITKYGKPWDEISHNIADMAPAHQAVFHHKKYFEEHGVFDESYRFVGDFELLLRGLKSSAALFVPDVTIACWARGGISSAPKNRIAVVEERWRALDSHAIPRSKSLSLLWRVKYRIFQATRAIFGTRIAERYLEIERHLAEGMKRALWLGRRSG